MIAFVPMLTSNYQDPWAWGTASKNLLEINRGGVASAKQTLLLALFSNMPQVVLSFCYLNMNTLCTSIACAEEWNHFGITRKGLRVTKPEGEQRSTYFLQLPYRWAVPLMVVSGLLHWLLSQSFYLVRYEQLSRTGEPQSSTSACGFSMSSLVTFYGIALGLVVGVRWVGRRPMIPTVPPADCCSLFISASCHPPPGDDEASLERVKWGVVEGTSGAGHHHCSLSSKPVKKPELGMVYY